MPPTDPLDPESRRGLEALLFLADEPLELDTLAELVEAEPATVEAALHELADEYERSGRGMQIRAVAGGWRMYTAPAAHPIVERWALSGRTGRLTQAALETLAVVAYKQPIGRQEIGDIRGVNADAAVRSLVARGYVEQVGRDDGPGQPALFGTTRLFLERVGIDALDDLPPLTDFLPEAPAPDEPELDGFKEVRRRLAAGGGFADQAGDAEVAATGLGVASLGGRTAAETNTGAGAHDPDDPDDHDEHLPPPSGTIGRGRGGEDIDELTEELERAARNAMVRLRAAVGAEEHADEEPSDEPVGEGPHEPGEPGERADEGLDEPGEQVDDEPGERADGEPDGG